MKVDFDLLKINISLPDFLRDQLGWSFAEGSTYKNPKLTSPSGDQTIVIKKNAKDFYTYWDVHNDSIRGKSIIDLMVSHIYNTTGENITFRRSGEILQTYVDSGKTVLPQNSSFHLSGELLDPEQILRTIRDCLPVHDFSFFNKRGFNPDILNTREWKNVFLQRKHVINDNGNVKSYINTCVKLLNPIGIQGLSQRNEQFKGAMGNRYDTIAASNIDRSLPVNLHLCESLLDGLAYFQMNNYLKENSNNLFVSSEGALSDGQLNTIQTIINKNQIASIEHNFDNDLAGMIFSIKALNLDFQNKNDDIGRIHVIKGKENDDNMIFLDLVLNSTEVLKTIIPDDMKEQFDNDNFKITHINSTNGKEHYQLSFPAEKEFMKELTKNIMSYKYGKSVTLKNSLSKDFNDDLKLEADKTMNNNNQLIL